MTIDHELMTTAEVAELFRVSPSQVRRWIQAGKTLMLQSAEGPTLLTAFRTPGGQLRLRRSEM